MNETLLDKFRNILDIEPDGTIETDSAEQLSDWVDLVNELKLEDEDIDTLIEESVGNVRADIANTDEFNDEELDIVSEAIISDINNGGIEVQISFLMNQFDGIEMNSELESLAE